MSSKGWGLVLMNIMAQFARLNHKQMVYIGGITISEGFRYLLDVTTKPSGVDNYFDPKPNDMLFNETTRFSRMTDASNGLIRVGYKGQQYLNRNNFSKEQNVKPDGFEIISTDKFGEVLRIFKNDTAIGDFDTQGNRIDKAMTTIAEDELLVPNIDQADDIDSFKAARTSINKRLSAIKTWKSVNGYQTGFDVNEVRIIEVSPQRVRRYFDNQGNWTLEIDPNGVLTAQMSWGENHKLRSLSYRSITGYWVRSVDLSDRVVPPKEKPGKRIQLQFFNPIENQYIDFYEYNTGDEGLDFIVNGHIPSGEGTRVLGKKDKPFTQSYGILLMNIMANFARLNEIDLEYRGFNFFSDELAYLLSLVAEVKEQEGVFKPNPIEHITNTSTGVNLLKNATSGKLMRLSYRNVQYVANDLLRVNLFKNDGVYQINENGKEFYRIFDDDKWVADISTDGEIIAERLDFTFIDSLGLDSKISDLIKRRLNSIVDIKRNSAGFITGYDTSGKPVVEFSPNKVNRFFNDNGQWIAEASPSGILTAQISWEGDRLVGIRFLNLAGKWMRLEQYFSDNLDSSSVSLLLEEDMTEAIATYLTYEYGLDFVWKGFIPSGTENVFFKASKQKDVIGYGLVLINIMANFARMNNIHLQRFGAANNTEGIHYLLEATTRILGENDFEPAPNDVLIIKENGFVMVKKQNEELIEEIDLIKAIDLLNDKKRIVRVVYGDYQYLKKRLDENGRPDGFEKLNGTTLRLTKHGEWKGDFNLNGEIVKSPDKAMYSGELDEPNDNLYSFARIKDVRSVAIVFNYDPDKWGMAIIAIGNLVSAIARNWSGLEKIIVVSKNNDFPGFISDKVTVVSYGEFVSQQNKVDLLISDERNDANDNELRKQVKEGGVFVPHIDRDYYRHPNEREVPLTIMLRRYYKSIGLNVLPDGEPLVNNKVEKQAGYILVNPYSETITDSTIKDVVGFWARVINNITELGYPVALNSMPNDRRIDIEAIYTQLRHPEKVIIRSLSKKDMLSFIQKNTRLVITKDTGLYHAAHELFGIPTIVFRTEVGWVDPSAKNVKVLDWQGIEDSHLQIVKGFNQLITDAAMTTTGGVDLNHIDKHLSVSKDSLFDSFEYEGIGVQVQGLSPRITAIEPLKSLETFLATR